MLQKIKDLRRFTIEAKDGEIGSIHDFLFQENNWSVRYVVVDPRKYLPGRKVLIIPEALGKPGVNLEVFPVMLTNEQIENSPDMDWAEPVSKEMEEKLHTFFGWPPYWIPEESGTAVFPKSDSGDKKREVREKPGEGESNLRSLNEVGDYSFNAIDGDIGEVSDFVVDDDDWKIRYMVVDTSEWLPGGRLLSRRTGSIASIGPITR